MMTALMMKTSISYNEILDMPFHMFNGFLKALNELLETKPQNGD